MSVTALPVGWSLIRRVAAKRCSHCGHEEPERPGELIAPDGRRVGLIGNRSRAQEDAMVAAVIAAHPIPSPPTQSADGAEPERSRTR